MKPKLFDISLAQWSLHRALQGGYIQSIDFPRIAKDQFGINAVEYVNSFFPERKPEPKFVNELKRNVMVWVFQVYSSCAMGRGTLATQIAELEQKQSKTITSGLTQPSNSTVIQSE